MQLSPSAVCAPMGATLLLAPLAAAAPQGLPDALVTDTSGDTIQLCTDANADGDYNDAGELSIFYDDQQGALQLTNNVALLRSPDGAVFVTDTTEDRVFRLEDTNGDGDALDAGEAAVWFDGTSGNPTGIELTSPRGMWLDPDGTLFVASANSGGGGIDGIYRFQDVNADGDANDAGEQSAFYVPTGLSTVGDSIPTAVSRGADGALYYVETGSTGFLAKGVYRLDDADMSGAIDPATEVTPFFIPSTTSGNPFFWDLGLDAQGRFYLSDTGNDLIWRFADGNGDGVIDGSTEADVIFQATGSSLVWEVTPALDGSIYLAEDQNPDRLVRLVDTDGDGLFLDPAEAIEIYSEAVSPIDIGSPKGISLIEGGTVFAANECTGAVVPHSGAIPAAIEARGSDSIAVNDLTLRAFDMPANQFGFFLASETPDVVTQVQNSQGTLCLGGDIGRYSLPGEVRFSGPAGTFELVLDASALRTSTASVPASAGDTWRFQAWFRDALPGGGPTSNFTDAVAITFAP